MEVSWESCAKWMRGIRPDKIRSGCPIHGLIRKKDAGHLNAAWKAEGGGKGLAV
jgi:hypothetical protein